jgi:hypothetical protein
VKYNKKDDVTGKTITIIKVDVYYLKDKVKYANSRGFTEEEINKVKLSVEREFSKGKYKDPTNGNDVQLEVSYNPLDPSKNEDVAKYNSLNNNDPCDPSVAIVKTKLISTTVVMPDEDGNKTEYDGTQEGAADWGYFEVSNVNDGHTILHEIWLNLTHNHLNSPKEIKSQINLKKQEEGHRKTGGIFIYENLQTGQDKQNLNLQNVTNALECIPEQ